MAEEGAVLRTGHMGYLVITLLPNKADEAFCIKETEKT